MAATKEPVEETVEIKMLGDEIRPLGITRRGTMGVKRKKSFTEYFIGPRDMMHHSKWPFFLRLHGSIVPKMIIPLVLIAAWATAFTCFYQFVKPGHKFDNVLLSVLGFVVGLSLSFRGTTAYERYNEGRKYWAQLQLTIHNLARVVWIHCQEREGDLAVEDLLSKVTLLNLLVAFPYAIKHRLQYEPYISYEDLRERINYLDTYAQTARTQDLIEEHKTSKVKRLGDYLGVPMLRDNPRVELKNATAPLGNLPLEILVHMQIFFDTAIAEGRLKGAPIYQMQCINSLQTLNDVMTGCDRILNTPLPLAYSICIAQITYTYIILLPFQIYAKLGWFTIPATAIAAYIILGLAYIGQEIENPFGDDVNDLPLEEFCRQMQAEVEVIASKKVVKSSEWMKDERNKPLWPLSRGNWDEWIARGEDDIRDALKARVYVGWRADNEAAALLSTTA